MKRCGAAVMMVLPMLAVLALCGCSSMSEKSHSIFADKVSGIDRLDPTSSEQKEDAKWFDSYYGQDHCGVWEGACRE
jgi:hypothetical protein